MPVCPDLSYRWCLFLSPGYLLLRLPWSAFFLFPICRFQLNWLLWPIGAYAVIQMGVYGGLIFRGQDLSEGLWLVIMLSYFAGLGSLWQHLGWLGVQLI